MISWALLDRDGTLNEPAPEGAYVSDVGGVSLLPGAADAVRRLNDRLEAVIVVTNQRGVALGVQTALDVEKVNARINELLQRAKAHIDAFFVCPHAIGTCTCRKPQPGMLYDAAKYVGLPLGDAVLIGDSEVDVEAAHAVGAKSIRIVAPGVTTAACATVPTLSAGVDLVLQQCLDR